MNKKELKEINNKFVNLLDIIKDNHKEVFKKEYNLELNKHLEMNKKTLSYELKLYTQKNDIKILF